MIVKLDRSGANGTFQSSHYFSAFLLWTVILHADGAQSSGSRTFRSLGHEASVREKDLPLRGFSFSSFGSRHRIVIILIKNQPTTVSMRYIFALAPPQRQRLTLSACRHLHVQLVRTRQADNQAEVSKRKQAQRSKTEIGAGSEKDSRNNWWTNHKHRWEIWQEDKDYARLFTFLVFLCWF